MPILAEIISNGIVIYLIFVITDLLPVQSAPKWLELSIIFSLSQLIWKIAVLPYLRKIYNNWDGLKSKK